MTVKLPQPLVDYFAAKNRHDIDGMLIPFSPDATVRDEGEIHQGAVAIRDWMEATTRKYRVTVEIADGVKVKIQRHSIAAVLPKDTLKHA